MYEVHSDYGAAQFETEQDAVNALMLLGQYHDLMIDRGMVEERLREEAYFESLPLAVIKS